jgi:hypothetical protein
MPRQAWMEWRAAYNPDLDMFTDAATNQACGPSGFAPANLSTQPWTTLTLTADEIRGLTGQAPKELQAIFGATAASSITSISFEFCSAAIVRTWFNSAMFNARFWKFGDSAPDLSDGNTPPKGAWPAYISAVVFARNIRVTTSAAPQSPPQPIRVLPVLIPRHVMPPTQPAAPPVILHPRFTTVAPPTVAGSATATVVRDHRTAAPSASPGVVRSAASFSQVLLRPRTATVNPALRLDAAVYCAQPVVRPPATPQPTPATPSTQPDDQVSILAFICKSLPRVPNPDPALHW